MAVDAEQVISQGDLMRRIRRLEKLVERLQSDRRLESASIGEGGLRVKGGSIAILDSSGVETMRLSTDGLTLTGILTVLGEIQVTGNSIVVFDPGGAEIFRAGAEGLTLQGLLSVVGGGDIQVTDGRLVASDGSGDVFAVDPRVPSITMRPELVSDLHREIFGSAIRSATVEDSESLSSSSYGDLSSAGPTISSVEIGDSGRALVFITAHQNVTGSVFGATGQVFMSFAVSGATTLSANDVRALALGMFADITNEVSGYTISPNARHTRLVLVANLNAGTHTFTAKYRQVSTNGDMSIHHRNLTIIPF